MEEISLNIASMVEVLDIVLQDEGIELHAEDGKLVFSDAVGTAEIDRIGGAR